MANTLTPGPLQLDGLYPYEPNEILPVIFATLIGISLLFHTYQNL
jgi:hypothetical protein